MRVWHQGVQQAPASRRGDGGELEFGHDPLALGSSDILVNRGSKHRQRHTAGLDHRIVEPGKIELVAQCGFRAVALADVVDCLATCEGMAVLDRDRALM